MTLTERLPTGWEAPDAPHARSATAFFVGGADLLSYGSTGARSGTALAGYWKAGEWSPSGATHPGVLDRASSSRASAILLYEASSPDRKTVGVVAYGYVRDDYVCLPDESRTVLFGSGLAGALTGWSSDANTATGDPAAGVPGRLGAAPTAAGPDTTLLPPTDSLVPVTGTGVTRASSISATADAEAVPADVAIREALARWKSESRWVLALVDDWDDAGSPGYREETWQRATSLLDTLVMRARSSGAANVVLPVLGPAEMGSIDLYWNALEGQLLINVPASDRPPTYSWRRPPDERTWGSITGTEEFSRLTEWLQRLS